MSHLFDSQRAMRQRRETVEHPFGTIKSWMGATHFLPMEFPDLVRENLLSMAGLG